MYIFILHQMVNDMLESLQNLQKNDGDVVVVGMRVISIFGPLLLSTAGITSVMR